MGCSTSVTHLKVCSTLAILEKYSRNLCEYDVSIIKAPSMPMVSGVLRYVAGGECTSLLTNWQLHHTQQSVGDGAPQYKHGSSSALSLVYGPTSPPVAGCVRVVRLGCLVYRVYIGRTGFRRMEAWFLRCCCREVVGACCGDLPGRYILHDSTIAPSPTYVGGEHVRALSCPLHTELRYEGEDCCQR